ncbi:MAG: ATP-binding protein [Kiritimatiellae bacterium]|nr:ATP-binding protein [Kiritimatiellia bacterium]
MAIASGKGGTGKTTVAVHLAACLAAQGRAVQYLDCDVEEPNGHLFLKPKMERSESVGIPVPVVDAAQCTSCGKCAEVCEFNAIAMLKKPLVFPELCHGCGACALVCPVGAIRETSRAIGVVETGRTGTIGFAQGRLNVGEPMAPPLIRAVKARRNPDAIALFDSPPGTSCPVVATVRDADLVVLVTEPTPFGLHDLALAVDTFRPMGKPMGVVVNRADDDRRVQDYCQAENLPVLAELPDDRRVAETYARGELVFDRLPEWRDRFDALWSRIEECL